MTTSNLLTFSQAIFFRHPLSPPEIDVRDAANRTRERPAAGYQVTRALLIRGKTALRPDNSLATSNKDFTANACSFWNIIVLSLELFYKAKNVPIDVDSGQSNKNNEVKKRGGGKVNCLQFIGGPI
jgi:hypothetical protein